jgi:TPR repeat protein
MDGSAQISLTQHSDWSCPRCHHDLSQLPPSAHFCPRCGQNQLQIPLAEFYIPPPPPAPEHFHSVVIVGYARAMTSLGTRYESGHGVARNSDEALRCYCKAARLGNSEARSRLVTRGITSPAASTSTDAPSDPPSPPVATAPQTP